MLLVSELLKLVSILCVYMCYGHASVIQEELCRVCAFLLSPRECYIHHTGVSLLIENRCLGPTDQVFGVS